MIISCKNYIISSDEWAKLKGLFTYYVTRFNGFRSLHACSYSFNTESPNHTGKGISPEKILLRQGLDITPSGVDFTPTANILVVSQELGTNQLGIRRHVWKSEATRVMPL